MSTHEENPDLPSGLEDTQPLDAADTPEPTISVSPKRGGRKAAPVVEITAEDIPEVTHASSRIRDPWAVYGTEETDTISLAAVKYKNVHARKSLSVKHVQRALTEKGYREADSDKDGYYGDLTQTAVANFQRDAGLEVTGVVDWETFSRLFVGDPNVTLSL